MAKAAGVLPRIDDYAHNVNQPPETVATQVARQLAEPRPRDAHVLDELDGYRGLAAR